MKKLLTLAALTLALSGMAYGENVVIFNLSSEPKTLDPQLNSATDGGIVINNTFEGLVRVDAEGMVQPATAESWEVSADGKTYTFKIRKDAKWSDGKPVTAHDFEYAWKRALDPSVASEYSFQLYYLKNGQDYFEGNAKREDVGVKAVDDKTLVVELAAPTPYFLNLSTFYTFMPVREDVVAKKTEGWAKDPSIAVSNGPFAISDYKISDNIKLRKNEYYWGEEDVKIDGIDFIEIVDSSTAYTAYENGEVDILTSVPNQMISKLEYEDDTFYIEPYLGTYYYIFNVDAEPTDNLDVRKALTLAIDREKIVEEVTKAGQEPANGFVPYGLTDSTGADFRETGGDYGIETTADITKAKEHLAKAGYPNGKGFPELTLMYNTNENHKAIAEAIQEMWKKNLGINIKLMNQEWAVFQDTRHNGNFTIARAGWIGDYGDPMTFLDLFTSYSGNNDAQWKWTDDAVKHADNKKFDEAIEASKLAGGADRDKLMYEAERLMMDNMVVMPIYYYTGTVMVKERIEGWERDILGTWYLGRAEIVD